MQAPGLGNDLDPLSQQVSTWANLNENASQHRIFR